MSVADAKANNYCARTSRHSRRPPVCRLKIQRHGPLAILRTTARIDRPLLISNGSLLDSVHVAGPLAYISTSGYDDERAVTGARLGAYVPSNVHILAHDSRFVCLSGPATAWDFKTAVPAVNNILQLGDVSKWDGFVRPPVHYYNRGASFWARGWLMVFALAQRILIIENLDSRVYSTPIIVNKYSIMNLIQCGLVIHHIYW
ncbi:unnamed protein product [Anisakis simplex]|uniref:GMC_OxRdtase_N domain-containing protein n=1 Tax=Anisakis simplex TaxID=6269 RepID=A0A0M3K6M7_ANISI|nr:unnamed protein product [Anisakis simplex]